MKEEKRSNSFVNTAQVEDEPVERIVLKEAS